MPRPFLLLQSLKKSERRTLGGGGGGMPPTRKAAAQAEHLVRASGGWARGVLGSPSVTRKSFLYCLTLHL